MYNHQQQNVVLHNIGVKMIVEYCIFKQRQIKTNMLNQWQELFPESCFFLSEYRYEYRI